MPTTRIITETMIELHRRLDRASDALTRMEANQALIMSQDAHSYSRIQQSLTEQTKALARVEARQTDFIAEKLAIARIEARQQQFQGNREILLRLEAGQTHVFTALNHMLTTHGEVSGRVESLQEAISRQDEPPQAQLFSKMLEWGLKLASNWAPISAGVVAAYKWGLPYLRQYLGLP